ncbi:actin cytoskeleton organization protein [Infundibulicybe gibba]|nr:actin cytoskeleton organization protein [Infundibulicybe gibba]
MMHVLRGLGRHNDMVTMFEEAYKIQPANEELGAQTFFANVRAAHWKSAQQIATKMYKQFQEDRYLYWSVISAVLQANDVSTPSNMRELLYKLAHRLITSSPTPSYLSADRFHLHLSILRELKLFDEARKLLESDVGKSICSTSLSCNELRRDLWRLQGSRRRRGNKLNNAYDRNWLEFLSLLDATFVYFIASPEVDEATKISGLEHVAKTQDLLERIREKDELERRARTHDIARDPSRMVTLLQDYFNKIGDKACYLATWTAFLEAIPPSFTTENDLRRLINSHKLLRYDLPPSITIEEELGRADIYTKQYLEGLKLGLNLPSSELQPADDLVLLASNVLVNVWTMSKDDRHLLSAVALLEYALTRSKQSFHIRLMLIRIYRLLGAPTLALEHYRAMHIKQVQHDTLSHFVLSRSSTFSLAATGDLTLATECLESTQIYLSNSQETGDFVVRAFTAEKYSQIPEFIAFEDRLDNSLQRDIVKMEHLRMRLAHETITSDVIDMELIELKFIFDRTHHDNRDFDILGNYQPRCCESFNRQTLLFGKAEGHGWLSTYLKLYIRALQQGSDLDDTVEEKLLIGDRPKQSVDPAKRIPLRERLVRKEPADLTELTPDECMFVEYASALAEWLEPYHDYTRPPPSVVLAEAAKQTELKTGHPLKGIEIPHASNGNGKKDEEPPLIKDPPRQVLEYFDHIRSRLQEVADKTSPIEVLHIAVLAQEAFILFAVETLRFKSPSVVKTNKLGPLVANFKGIRAHAIPILRDISSALIKRSETESMAEHREMFIDASVPTATKEIDGDFLLDIAKRVTDSRKKVLEGVGKGLSKICSTYHQ